MSRRPLQSLGAQLSRSYHTNVPVGRRWSESPVLMTGPDRPLRKAAEISPPPPATDIDWCEFWDGTGPILSSSQSAGLATITFASSDLGCGVYCTPFFGVQFDGTVSDVQLRVIASDPDRETQWMPVPAAWANAYYNSGSDYWDTGIYWDFSWNGSLGPPDTITVEVQWVGDARVTSFCTGVADNQ